MVAALAWGCGGSGQPTASPAGSTPAGALDPAARAVTMEPAGVDPQARRSAGPSRRSRPARRPRRHRVRGAVMIEFMVPSPVEASSRACYAPAMGRVERDLRRPALGRPRRCLRGGGGRTSTTVLISAGRRRRQVALPHEVERTRPDAARHPSRRWVLHGRRSGPAFAHCPGLAEAVPFRLMRLGWRPVVEQHPIVGSARQLVTRSPARSKPGLFQRMVNVLDRATAVMPLVLELEDLDPQRAHCSRSWS